MTKVILLLKKRMFDAKEEIVYCKQKLKGPCTKWAINNLKERILYEKQFLKDIQRAIKILNEATGPEGN